MEIYTRDDNNVRCTWNLFPTSKVDQARYICPIGFHYTPLKPVEDLQLLEYKPVQCAQCQSILNPFCNIDFRSKAWECPFCLKRNPFPAHYAQNINETTLPPEVMNEYTTVEYKLDKKESSPPLFLFIVDIGVDLEELQELKDQLQLVLSTLPEDCLVGFITFGKMAYLHEISFSEMQRMLAFRGDKEYSAQEIHDILGLTTNKKDPRGGENILVARKFLQPLRDCNFHLNSLIDELAPDEWERQKGERRPSCAGLALNIGVTLLETVCNGDPCRISLFCGNPPTIGSGKIVNLSLTETIRNYVDFQKHNTNTVHFKAAVDFYSNVATRASKAGQIIDIYACSLNQTGLLEMKACVESTGGCMILSDSFSTMQFKDSFTKLYELDENNFLKMGFRGKLDLFLSQPLKVSGGIGYMNSMNVINFNMVSSEQVGHSKTRVWSLGGINSNSTYSFLLDFDGSSNVAYKRAVCQIVTTYVAGDKTTRQRVTTFKRSLIADFTSTTYEVAQSFDQEAATVMLARLAVVKSAKEESIEILRWVDKTIIRLISKFSEYKKDDTNSFRLSKEFKMFPQFIFYLRRSPFLQDFNASPDESTFYKSTLLNENILNATVMIQPVLFTYTAEKPDATPTHLDIECMQDNVVLLLDAYFFICIWHGEAVAKWRDQGIQYEADYENVKFMLENPQEYAQELLQERLPVPKFVSCDSGNGQERLIKCVVNPSMQSTENSLNGKLPDGYYTDDVSLKKFMDHLIKKVVSS